MNLDSCAFPPLTSSQAVLAWGDDTVELHSADGVVAVSPCVVVCADGAGRTVQRHPLEIDVRAHLPRINDPVLRRAVARCWWRDLEPHLDGVTDLFFVVTPSMPVTTLQTLREAGTEVISCRLLVFAFDFCLLAGALLQPTALSDEPGHSFYLSVGGTSRWTRVERLNQTERRYAITAIKRQAPADAEVVALDADAPRQGLHALLAHVQGNPRLGHPTRVTLDPAFYFAQAGQARPLIELPYPTRGTSRLIRVKAGLPPKREQATTTLDVYVGLGPDLRDRSLSGQYSLRSVKDKPSGRVLHVEALPNAWRVSSYLGSTETYLAPSLVA